MSHAVSSSLDHCTRTGRPSFCARYAASNPASSAAVRLRRTPCSQPARPAPRRPSTRDRPRRARVARRGDGRAEHPAAGEVGGGELGDAEVAVGEHAAGKGPVEEPGRSEHGVALRHGAAAPSGSRRTRRRRGPRAGAAVRSRAAGSRRPSRRSAGPAGRGGRPSPARRLRRRGAAGEGGTGHPEAPGDSRRPPPAMRAFAEPPAESPSTMKSSASSGFRIVQSASLPGRRRRRVADLRSTSFLAVLARRSSARAARCRRSRSTRSSPSSRDRT